MNDIYSSPDKRAKFDFILNKYYSYFYIIIYRIIQNQHDMDDILQEVHLLLWDNLDKLPNDNCAKSWLAIVARNLALNSLKEHRRTDAEFSDNIFPADAAGSSPIPEDIVISRETVRMVLDEIQSMDNIYSDVLIMKYKFEYTVPEIAQALNLNEKTVYTRLERGRKLLRKRLEKLEL